MKKKLTSIRVIIISAVCLVTSTVLYLNSGIAIKDSSFENNYAQTESDAGKTIEYFVAPDGSDQDAGTKAEPLKTLMGAFEKLKAN